MRRHLAGGGDSYDDDAAHYSSSNFSGSNMLSRSSYGHSHRFKQDTWRDTDPRLQGRKAVPKLELCNYLIGESILNTREADSVVVNCSTIRVQPSFTKPWEDGEHVLTYDGQPNACQLWSSIRTNIQA